MRDALSSDESFSPASSRIAALRRVSGTEIVDQGIQLARQNYEALLMAGSVPLLATVAMRTWLFAHPHRVTVWSNLLLILFNSVWGALANASAARVAMDVLEGRPPDAARALAVAFRRALPVVLTGLCRAVLVLAGLVMLVIPGLYVISTFVLAPALPVLEPGIGGLQGFRRSATLTNGARRLVFGACVLPAYFASGASVVMTLLTSRVLRPHAGQLISALVGISVVAALTPFIAAILVRLYVELRMRKEAIDIEWALAAPSPDAVA